MESGLDKQESLWLTMLESILTKKIDQSGNVILLGNPKTGKKHTIKLMQRLMDQETNDNNNKEEDYKDLDKVYIMDFKYIKMKKDDADEDFHDAGKINFHIINRKYRFMNEFWSREMFKNMLIVIVVDLDDPENIEKDFKEWNSFIHESIKSVLNEVDVVVRKKIFANFKKTIELMKTLNKDYKTPIEEGVKEEKIKEENKTPKKKEYSVTEIIEEEEEEESTDENKTTKKSLEKVKEEKKVIGEVIEMNEEEEGEEDEDEEEDSEDKDDDEDEDDVLDIDNFKIPLLLLANKSDCLDTVNDENLLNYIEFTLRKLAVENDAFLVCSSNFQERNIDNLLDLLFYSLLEKTDEINLKNLETNFILDKLFLPNGTDKLSDLEKNLKGQKYDFPKKKRLSNIKNKTSEKKDMSMIQNFFKDVNTGVMNYSNNEVSYSSRNINYNYNSSSRNSRNNGLRSNRPNPINTTRIQNILNRNKN